ncbi:MAG: hypothetical protein LUG18_02815 [Candidatus Azobacteroides sp.]|nr:hypothetical protein [Candidatus Azobacteroides sp.]
MKSLFYYSLLLYLFLPGCSKRIPEEFISGQHAISISPDYQALTIPWNIAPLNFIINEEADEYLAAAHGKDREKKLIASGKKITWNLKE